MAISVIFPLVNPSFVVKGAGGAGGSSRMYAKIDNREVFLRSVELYARRDQVVQRIVVVPPDDLTVMQEKYSAHLGFQGVTVAGGGSDWFGCVGRALEKLQADIQFVIIHDPSCPAVPYTLLDALEEAIAKGGGSDGGAGGGIAGVVPVVACRSGFAELSATPGTGGSIGRMGEYVDMAQVYEVQSPQIFLAKLLLAAYEGGAGRGKDIFVDDAELMLSAGHKIGTVAGSRLNQRIDSDEMVRLGKDLIEHTPKPKPKTPLTPFGEAEW